jgi:ABC-2 type transport system permease protein
MGPAMAAEGAAAGPASAGAALVARRIARRTPLESIYGFGSVFAKGLRDSRWAILGTGIGLGLLAFFTASQVAIQFPTAADRLGLVATSQELPAVMVGMLGDPINVDKLGGFLSWRFTNFLPIILGIWSILALSGTLASEARRGSLDLLVTTPLSRTRIAVSKLAVHLVGLVLATLLLSALTALSGLLFARLPGDEISFVDSLSQYAGVTLSALVAGGIAFALAPVLGRVPAAGVAAVALFGAYVVNSYASLVPLLDSIRGVSWFGWIAGHRPLAGVSDPVPVLALAAVVAVLLGLGVAAFVRRDVGGSLNVPAPRLSERGLGVRGPAGRSFAGRLPASVLWGLGIGLYGLIIASSASTFADALAQIPGIQRMIEQFYPGLDFTSSPAFLQLAFVGFGLLMLGLVAVVLVSGWTSDEREKRLDLVLSAPLRRRAWAVRSGFGAQAALAVTSLIVALLLAAGAAIDGSSPAEPFVGGVVAGLYAAAIAGAGIAAAGLVSPTAGIAVAALLAVGSYLLDFIGAALRLPDVVLDLALSRHLGRPMLGEYDWIGLGVCAMLAVGGVFVAAWGLERRDLRG